MIYSYKKLYLESRDRGCVPGCLRTSVFLIHETGVSVTQEGFISTSRHKETIRALRLTGGGKLGDS